MRRTIPRLTLHAGLALAAVAGLAAPALAAGTDDTTTTRPEKSIDLTCAKVDDLRANDNERRSSIGCEWDAVADAAGYRVFRAHPQLFSNDTQVLEIAAPGLTERRVTPGYYVFGVQAIDADGNAIARSGLQMVHLEDLQPAG